MVANVVEETGQISFFIAHRNYAENADFRLLDSSRGLFMTAAAGKSIIVFEVARNSCSSGLDRLVEAGSDPPSEVIRLECNLTIGLVPPGWI